MAGSAEFKVDTGDLQGLASHLSSLFDELTQAGAFNPDASAAGHPGVISSLESFFSDWRSGLQQTTSNLSKLTDRLATGANDYDSTEGDIGGAFGG